MTTNPATQNNPAFTGDITNDSFRRAFDAIARKAVPFFDAEYAYFSDLLWDAQRAATMLTARAPDRFYISVRDMGTNVHASLSDAQENHGIEPRAILLVEYDGRYALSVRVIWSAPSRREVSMAMYRLMTERPVGGTERRQYNVAMDHLINQQIASATNTQKD